MKDHKKPTANQLTSLQRWLGREDGGDGFLYHEEALIWKDENADDLISLYSGKMEGEVLTKLVSGTLLDFDHLIGAVRQEVPLDFRPQLM